MGPPAAALARRTERTLTLASHTPNTSSRPFVIPPRPSVRPPSSVRSVVSPPRRHPSESWDIPVEAATLANRDTPAFAGVTDVGRGRRMPGGGDGCQAKATNARRGRRMPGAGDECGAGATDARRRRRMSNEDDGCGAKVTQERNQRAWVRVNGRRASPTDSVDQRPRRAITPRYASNTAWLIVSQR